MDPDKDDDNAEPSIRDALGAALDQQPSDQGTDDAASPPASGTPAPTGTPAPAAGQEGQTRDALGRFVVKTGNDGVTRPVPAPAADQGTRTPVAGTPTQGIGAINGLPQGQAAPAEQAPVSWGVAARQHWANVPAEARAEIVRREAEIQQALHQTAGARNLAQQFMQAVSPYRQAIQLEAGGDPLRAVQGLMDTASRLRFGTAQEKAATVAGIIQSYGVDLQTLDSLLAGVAPPQSQGFNPQMIEQVVQRQMQPLMQRFESVSQQRNQRLEAEVDRELREFAADAKNEFYQDVKSLMADVMDLRERQGLQTDLSTAYNLACKLHPEVSKVLEARSAATSATTLNDAAQRAKKAAASVKGAAPMGSPNTDEPRSIRDALTAAIDSHSRT